MKAHTPSEESDSTVAASSTPQPPMPADEVSRALTAITELVKHATVDHKDTFLSEVNQEIDKIKRMGRIERGSAVKVQGVIYLASGRVGYLNSNTEEALSYFLRVMPTNPPQEIKKGIIPLT